MVFSLKFLNYQISKIRCRRHITVRNICMVAERHKIAIEQIQDIKEIPGISGVHIMAICGEKTVEGLAGDASLLPKPEVENIP